MGMLGISEVKITESKYDLAQQQLLRNYIIDVLQPVKICT